MIIRILTALLAASGLVFGQQPLVKPLTRGALPSALSGVPSRFFKQSPGDLLRTLEQQAATTNEWAPGNPYMYAVKPWQPNGFWNFGATVVSGGGE